MIIFIITGLVLFGIVYLLGKRIRKKTTQLERKVTTFLEEATKASKEFRIHLNVISLFTVLIIVTMMINHFVDSEGYTPDHH
ncbi:hypothetical protein J7M23_01145 [Candidatus Sumerlaeota bacterium]|nr:hypothetical protein [Candidatus Sumerlaeota bacterium]